MALQEDFLEEDPAPSSSTTVSLSFKAALPPQCLPQHLLRCAQLRCPQHASHELCQIRVFFNPRVDDRGAAASLGRWSERSRLRPSQAHVWASVWAQPLGSHIPPAIPPALPHAVCITCGFLRPCPAGRKGHAQALEEFSEQRTASPVLRDSPEQCLF